MELPTFDAIVAQEATSRKFAADPAMFERYGLDQQTYAATGGAVPLRVEGVGMVGVVAVSGLPPLEDHVMVVEALTGLIAWQLQN